MVTRTGSVWAERVAGAVRIDGNLPPDVTQLIREKGAFQRDGALWCSERTWRDIKSLLTIMGIAVADGDANARRQNQLDVTSIGDLAIYGAMPLKIPDYWLGRQRAKGYYGMSPWAIERALQTFQANSIETRIAPRAATMQLLALAQRQQALQALQRDAPDIGVFANGKSMYGFQRRVLPFAEATGGRFLLGDDPGTGKTICAIGLSRYLEARNVLVVCPSVAKYNWAAKVEEFDGEQTYVVNGRTSRLTRQGEKYVAINYDILDDRLDWLLDQKFDLLFFDESHYLKSKDSKRSLAARALASKVAYCVMMSGTPSPNGPADLWNQLDILQPGWWGEYFDFGLAFAGGVKTRFGWQFKKATNADVLNDYLKGIMLRRRKADVLPDLPAKTRTLYPVELTPTARREYEKEWKKFLANRKASTDASNEGSVRGQMLAGLTWLRQISSRGRVPATVDMVMDLVEAKRPAVVGTYFTDSMDGLKTVLSTKKDVTFGTIEGGMSAQRKINVANEFQAGEFDVLIGQIVAAGLSIDLFRSNVTLHHDIDWPADTNVQFEDRVNRNGQILGTEHIYMVGRGTIDETMVVPTIIRKMASSQGVLDTGRDSTDDVIAEIMRQFFS